MTEGVSKGEQNPDFQPDQKEGRPDPPGTRPKQMDLTTKELSPELKKKKFKILKNVFIISFAFMLNFVNTMGYLQSSINKLLGTTSLWVLYVAMVISCALVPSWLIRKLETKWAMCLCMFCFSIYIAANSYPTYYTLIPASILLGMGAAPMWSAKCSYLTKAGEVYGEIVGEESSIIITKFFGVFFLFFQSSNIWGQLISSTVLSFGIENVTKTEELLATCGPNFCPVAAKPPSNMNETAESSDVDMQKVITLVSIYLSFSVAAVAIIAIFVDPLSTITSKETLSTSESGKSLMVATFTHMKKINQLLLIPITMWSGLEQAFLSADFTAAFVTCGLGVHMMGYILISYAVCNAVCSIGFSPLVKRFGRVPIFTFGAVINLAMFVLLRLWMPNPDDIVIFFLIASAWGVGDAIWQTQINALYGALFTEAPEAAFSNYRLWESLGYIFAYVWSGYVCMDAKIYTLVAFLLFSMACYYVVEALERKGGYMRNGRKVVTLADLRR